MNGILRSGTVAIALSSLIGYIATHFQALLTDAVLSWVLIGGGAALTSLAISWGATQAYKFLYADPDLDGEAPVVPSDTPADAANRQRAWKEYQRGQRRHIYAFAMLSCFIPAAALGVVLFLFHLAHAALAVWIIVWVIGSLAVSLASPWLWKVVFLMLVPWAMAQEKRA